MSKSWKGGEIHQIETIHVSSIIFRKAHELDVKRSEVCEFDVKYRNFSSAGWISELAWNFKRLNLRQYTKDWSVGFRSLWRQGSLVALPFPSSPSCHPFASNGRWPRPRSWRLAEERGPVREFSAFLQGECLRACSAGRMNDARHRGRCRPV